MKPRIRECYPPFPDYHVGMLKIKIDEGDTLFVTYNLYSDHARTLNERDLAFKALYNKWKSISN